MEWTEEQKESILNHYESIEEYERITAIKAAQEYLNSTDYIVVKAYEYQLTNTEIEQDYTEVFAKREEARNIIRQLEKE